MSKTCIYTHKWNFTQGIVTSGYPIYIQGLVMKDKGPVFVTAFSPLSTVLVAIIGSFILYEAMCLGRCALIYLASLLGLLISLKI